MTVALVALAVGIVVLAVVIAVISYNQISGEIMNINEVLSEIKSNLEEASSEILSKISELESGGVDPALLSEVKSLAQGLADVVPNAVVGPSDSVSEGEVVEGTFTDEEE